MDGKEISGNLRCLARIRSVYPSLSHAQSNVADYVLQNPEEILDMDISELSVRASASKASVVRLCQVCGYAGFKELKAALRQEHLGVQSSLDINLLRDKDTQTIARKVVNSITVAMRETLSLLDEASLDRAVGRVLSCNRIYLYGIGSSGVIAEDASQRFMRFGIEAQAFSDIAAQEVSLRHLGRGDLAVGLSHSGSTPPVVNAMERARQAGAATIGITRYVKSLLTEHCDEVLVYSAFNPVLRKFPFSMALRKYEEENIISSLCMMLIFDILLVVAAARHAESEHSQSVPSGAAPAGNEEDGTDAAPEAAEG